MKEHPIIFQPEIVKSILECRTTMTRRVIKPQFRDWQGHDWYGKVNGYHLQFNDFTLEEIIKHCSYGQVGDRLWVRETWATDKMFDAMSAKQIEATGVATVPLWYKFGDTQEDNPNTTQGRWRSSRFTPRWASRIDLEITGIRVERVQEITEDDIAKEGVEVTFHEKGKFGIANPCATGVVDLPNGTRTYTTARGCFIRLWDSLNAKRGYNWESNCWVWVIEFRNLVKKG